MRGVGVVLMVLVAVLLGQEAAAGTLMAGVAQRRNEALRLCALDQIPASGSGTCGSAGRQPQQFRAAAVCSVAQRGSGRVECTLTPRLFITPATGGPAVPTSTQQRQSVSPQPAPSAALVLLVAVCVILMGMVRVASAAVPRLSARLRL